MCRRSPWAPEAATAFGLAPRPLPASSTSSGLPVPQRLRPQTGRDWSNYANVHRGSATSTTSHCSEIKVWKNRGYSCPQSLAAAGASWCQRTLHWTYHSSKLEGPLGVETRVVLGSEVGNQPQRSQRYAEGADCWLTCWLTALPAAASVSSSFTCSRDIG